MRKSTVIALASPLVITTPALAGAEMNDVTELIQSDDWATLKNIWQLANNIQPEGIYSPPIAIEKGDSIIVQLNSLFQEATQNPQLNTALEFTREIVTLRISRLSRINGLLMTRMMPPWTDQVQEDMLFNFQSRLTELDSLIEEKEITVAEFISARDTLLQKAETIMILELINQTDRAIYNFVPNDYDKVDTNIILEQLDLSYRAALDSLELHPTHIYAEGYENIVNQHEAFLEKYDEFRIAKPIFQLLLTDLMDP